MFLIDDKQVQLSIPKRVYRELDSNIEVPENSDAAHGDILKVAMLLFLNYVDAATAMSESYGGGGGLGTGWGKDKDEDELEWARRCAKMANWHRHSWLSQAVRLTAIKRTAYGDKAYGL